MAAPNFFNQNRNRAFPFQLGTVNLPDSGPLTMLNLPNDIVVDAGFVVGPRSGFATGVNSIYLETIRRVANTFYYDFVSDAPGLEDVLITFTRTLTDDDNLLEYTDSGDVGLSESMSTSESAGLCDEPLWSGYMVSGKMASLSLLLPTDGSIGPGDNAALLEPALIQNLAGAYVTKMGLANDDRTRVTSPADCADTVFPYPTGGLFINADCLLGDLVFKPGYNATITQEAAHNTITIGAAVGSGEGKPCTEVPLFADEVPPEGSNLLEGGPACNETLRSFNGIGGQMFSLLSGTGVTITPVPASNKLSINVNMSGLALCFNNLSTVSESV